MLHAKILKYGNKMGGNMLYIQDLISPKFRDRD